MAEAPGRDRLYRQIVEATPDAVIFADSEGVIRLWNAAATAIFGYAPAEAEGQTLDLIIPESLRARHWDGYTTVMRTGETKYGAELLAVPAMRKDGSRISLEFSIALLRDDAGAVLGAAAIVRDVTARFQEQRLLRQELASLKAALEEKAERLN